MAVFPISMEIFVIKLVMNFLKLKNILQTIKNNVIDYFLFGKVKRKVVDHIDYTECEVEYRGRFNKVIGYWAYGFYEYYLPYPRNKDELKDVRGYYKSI